MGQVNSTEANVENGKTGLIQKATEDLNAVAANGGNEDHIKCVKARIDMLIEDCLNLEAYSDSENDPKDGKSKANNSDKDGKEGEGKGTDENLIKEYLDGDSKHVPKEKEADCDKNDSDNRKNEEIEATEVKRDVKADDSEKEKGTEGKKSDSDTKATKGEHTRVSDLISEMVSTEINSNNLAQLQKRTITTFNTFIDKVLDTTLQQEMSQEDTKSPEPGIIQLVTESFLPVGEQARKSGEKSNATDGNRDPSQPATTKVTFKDHIEKLLEQTIQEHEPDRDKVTKKEVKRDKFDAQGLLNDIIKQGLKMTDSGAKSQLKIEPKRTMPDGYVQKNYKPNDRGGSRGQATDSYGQKSPNLAPSVKRETNDVKFNRLAPKEQGIPPEARYNKDLYMGWGRGGIDPRDMYNYHASARRPSLSERSRGEVLTMGSGNKHIPASLRGAEHSSAFQQLYPQFANLDYYKASMSNIGHSADIRGFPHRDNKPAHPRDCMCALCAQNARKVEAPVVDHTRDKRSPNVPPHLAGLPSHYRDQAMLRTYLPYQTSPKLLPHHVAVTSPKESTSHLIPPTDVPPMRRQSMSEGSQSSMYMYKRADDNTQIERSSAKPPVNISRPPSTGQRYSRALSTQSTSSDSSEAPLDLSVKKPRIDPSRHRSASFTAAPNKRMGVPMNNFIRHLENSVDKHWNEMCSPSSSPGHPSSPKNQLLYPDPRMTGQGTSRGCSPGAMSPSTASNMLHNRHLPTPHYVGGITVGQPLVNIERNSQPSNEPPYPPASPYDNQTQSQYPQSPGADSNRSSDNISKHEPIQNIIGNHDPNDILYLICRLCTQTYGSPYAFRKHFRSNHGFEPRADHTIVQTISATKMALHLPQPQDIQTMSSARKSPHDKSHLSPSPRKRDSPVSMKAPTSPTDTRSQHGSESGESDQIRSDADKTETKCLECPECGKSFQLNDFGSYKRHCRQHGNLLTSGPYTCTDCHLHFPDQKTLREHYLLHVKELPLSPRDEKKHSDSLEVKVESHKSPFSCNKCNVNFDKLEDYTKHVASHDQIDSDLAKQTKHTKEVNSAQMDISVNTSSSLNIVKQAAESMTSQMCPDSSWDNVVKGIATSNKPDEGSVESADYRNSPKSDTGTTNKMEDRSDNNSPAGKSADLGSDASDANTQDSSDVNIYKHKKFFHHRKRAHPNSLSEGADAKQAKLGDLNSAGATVSNSIKVLSVNNDSCDSSGFSDTGSNTSSVNDSTSAGGNDKREDKSSKTEARHNLPFVWDRPTRSQKKL